MTQPMNESNLLIAWKWNGFVLRLYDLGYMNQGYNMRPNLGYRLYDHGRLVMFGQEYGPSPLHSIDGIDSIMNLLTFLTIQPGDTDPEFFEGYTPTMLAWCQSSRAEELDMLTYDYESPDPGYTTSKITCPHCGYETLVYDNPENEVDSQHRCMYCERLIEHEVIQEVAAQ